MHWYPAPTPLLEICGPGNSFAARVPNATVESWFSTVERYSLTATRRCMPKQPEWGISAAWWSTASTNSCRMDFCPSSAKLAAWLKWMDGFLPQLISDLLKINGSIHTRGFWMKTTDVLHFCQQVIRNLWNRGCDNCFFDPTASGRFCILETQFSSSPLQLSDEEHCKSSMKPELKNQLSSVDAVKPIKERSSPGAILRGKSSTQGNQCQCWIK